MKNKSILFFDAQCLLCNRFVRFVLKKDLQKQLLYASLQGETAKKHLQKEDIQDLKSVIFLKKGFFFKEAQAIQEIMKCLFPRWKFLFVLFHPFVFNFFYRFIAKRRYYFFGKMSETYQASKDELKFFLP